VERLTGGRRACGGAAGINSAPDQAEACLGRHGRAVIIGMCMEPIRLSQPSVLFGYYDHAVLGHEGYFKRDLERLVRLVGSGRLDLSRYLSKTSRGALTS
jgi:threonine dehydrogenase-like Zn-dependent dehydrogenase